MKIIIILFLITSFYITNKTFQNKISVLAVHENENGDIVGGSKIDLNLKIERGNGQIFVNLDSVEEIDTQISIINSNKITCELFNLDCNKYNFYYSFDNSALILKGPSASSAIAVLTAKTVLKEKMDKNTVITGSLASGGIIGNVGGIDKKIEVAENMGFEKIVIPIFSKYNKTKNRTIEVLPAIDIIDAYNHFNGKQK